MKTAAVFKRGNPCTKVHLWNCFRGNGRFVDVPVVDAHQQIGNNAPKYLLREQYVTRVLGDNIDYYRLTAAGIRWLDKGVRRYLELHPEAAKDLKQPIPGTVSATTAQTAGRPRVIRRTR